MRLDNIHEVTFTTGLQPSGDDHERSLQLDGRECSDLFQSFVLRNDAEGYTNISVELSALGKVTGTVMAAVFTGVDADGESAVELAKLIREAAVFTGCDLSSVQDEDKLQELSARLIGRIVERYGVA